MASRNENPRPDGLIRLVPVPALGYPDFLVEVEASAVVAEYVLNRVYKANITLLQS